MIGRHVVGRGVDSLLITADQLIVGIEVTGLCRFDEILIGLGVIGSGIPRVLWVHGGGFHRGGTE